jgi:hypothetical protein
VGGFEVLRDVLRHNEAAFFAELDREAAVTDLHPLAVDLELIGRSTSTVRVERGT